MTVTISEPDWKVFRQLLPLALERFCQGVLKEIALVSEDTTRTSHDRYLAVYQLLKKRDKELDNTFDGPRRSTAFFQLASLHALGLLTEDEIERFSTQTRSVLRVFSGE